MTQEKQDPARDRLLGMNQPITRRDFLNGVAIGAAAASNPLLAAALADPAATASTAAQDAPGYYPPLLTGLRGNHPGSFEDAHALRDGRNWPATQDTGEEYDLIVVGAGLSGLAAAHFYRAQKPAGRILILDNHDDFGGHAKRNEFHLNGQLNLLNGGTLEIDSPRPYGPVAAGLLATLGIDVAKQVQSTQNFEYYDQLGLQRGVFFDQETFGADRLAVGLGRLSFEEFLAQSPLSATARASIVQIQEGKVDYLAGLSSDDKKDRLSRMSYEAFLRDVVRVEPAVLGFYHARTMGEWGVGTDAVSALDCWGFGLPGFQGMSLAKGSIRRMGFTPAGYEDTGGSLRLHFPDGNATLARLLVRDLIPSAVPGNSVEDVVTSRVNYAQLDRSATPIRLRLNSIAIRARHLGDPKSADRVEVTYLRGGRAFSARARGTVLACYNMMIPYLCTELPEVQKDALHKLVKTPLVYTSVALRNRLAFDALKVHAVYAPGGYHTYFHLNQHVNIGRYQSPQSAQDPILVHMVRTPCRPGLPEHDQNRAGRAELLSTPFATFERNIREQLARTLRKGGFDSARDITAITVNRWPHGYAPEYNPLFDPDVPESERAHVLGRAQFGRITVANSDAGGGAYTDSAIDQGHRAVMELLRG
ncbi:MAG TPA: FAD/NAD(P)-binding protein [Steroidobacteraceae bacterium]|jgi:spermidine dehydrogenase|nr:FAD/NAD(P)-binding protein [Steroidobacteraceae bacterium]